MEKMSPTEKKAIKTQHDLDILIERIERKAIAAALRLARKASRSLFPLAVIAHIILTPSHILNSRWHHDTAHDFVSAKFLAGRQS